jgi:hypothetical protein
MLVSWYCLYKGSLNELGFYYYSSYKPDNISSIEIPLYWFISIKNYSFHLGIDNKYSYNPSIYIFTACMLESNLNSVNLLSLSSLLNDSWIYIYEIYLISLLAHLLFLESSEWSNTGSANNSFGGLFKNYCEF